MNYKDLKHYCIQCGHLYEALLGCSACKHLKTKGSRNTLSKPQQPTNREIDAARAAVRRTLVTTRDTVQELVKDGKAGSATTLFELVGILNQGIQDHS